MGRLGLGECRWVGIKIRAPTFKLRERELSYSSVLCLYVLVSHALRELIVVQQHFVLINSWIMRTAVPYCTYLIVKRPRVLSCYILRSNSSFR